MKCIALEYLQLPIYMFRSYMQHIYTPLLVKKTRDTNRLYRDLRHLGFPPYIMLIYTKTVVKLN